MRAKRVILPLIIVTLLAAALNWYARKKMPDSYARQLSYNALYLDKDVLHIKKAESNAEQLMIQLDGDISNISSNITRQHFADSSTLVFKANDAGNQFWIKQDGRIDTIRFSITFTGTNSYKAAGNNITDNFELNSQDLIFSNATLSSHRDWAFGFTQQNAAQEKEAIRTYLRDSIGVADTDPGTEKLRKIFAHLMPIVQPNLGIPADSLAGKTPLELIRLLKTGNIKVWCGNLSMILGAMTNAAGLSTRLISTEGSGSFSYPVHAFNEVYLPEYGGWSYTDLTNGVAYIETRSKPLNTIQLNHILRSGINTDNVHAVTIRDSVRSISIDSLAPVFKSYLAAPQRFRFYYPQYLEEQHQSSPGSRIKKLIRPTFNYAFYSEDGEYGSGSFWLRAISGYLLIGTLFSVFFVGGVLMGGGRRKANTSFQ